MTQVLPVLYKNGLTGFKTGHGFKSGRDTYSYTYTYAYAWDSPIHVYIGYPDRYAYETACPIYAYGTVPYEYGTVNTRIYIYRMTI